MKFQTRSLCSDAHFLPDFVCWHFVATVWPQ